MLYCYSMKTVKDKFIITRVTKEEHERVSREAGNSISDFVRKKLGLDD